MQVLLIGLGAGIVSALLFIALASGSLLSVALFYLAPLPIMLAGLGWSHIAALTASLTAAVGLGIGAGFWFSLAFLAGVGVPAYILSYLAMLARPVNGDFEWYPIGRIVLAAAILATIAMALTIPVFGLDIDTYRAGLKEIFSRVLRLQLGIAEGLPLKFPNGGDPERTLVVLTLVMPPLAAALSMLAQLANLYLAGRIARASGKLARPWPDLSATAFPFSAPLLLFGVLVLSFLHSIIGLVAGAFTTCLLVAYALLGLAVLHHVTRAIALRGLILGITWGLLVVLGWPVVLLALIGLADGLLNFRQRLGPPNSNLTNRS
ncbi:MAG TPA: DUF2232 domain-containing protein [Xanthobacteraceae bacterium]|nr:DUF2232 domain-containing protein [Xanthobacteraceae bacterium]